MRVWSIVEVSGSKFCVWVMLIDKRGRMKRVEYGGCGEENKKIRGGGNVGFGGREGGIWGCRERLEKRLREIEIST